MSTAFFRACECDRVVVCCKCLASEDEPLCAKCSCPCADQIASSTTTTSTTTPPATTTTATTTLASSTKGQFFHSLPLLSLSLCSHFSRMQKQNSTKLWVQGKFHDEKLIFTHFYVRLGDDEIETNVIAQDRRRLDDEDDLNSNDIRPAASAGELPPSSRTNKNKTKKSHDLGTLTSF